METKNEHLMVKCPTCKRVGAWFGSAHGPFCSRRCKLIDLGKWFNEENKLSEPLTPGSLLHDDFSKQWHIWYE